VKLNPTPSETGKVLPEAVAVRVQQLACENSPNELDHPLTVAFCLDHAQRELNGRSVSQWLKDEPATRDPYSAQLWPT
jgi:hypothetical protein